MEDNEGGEKIIERAELMTNIVGSEEMELRISHIHEKIEHFTDMVLFWVVFLSYVVDQKGRGENYIEQNYCL